jgi:hypothetical protein
MSGNGKSGVTIKVTEVDDHYAVFTVGEHAPGVDATKALHQCVTDWYQSKGQVRIYSSVPIVSEGSTWAIHVWFEPRPKT